MNDPELQNLFANALWEMQRKIGWSPFPSRRMTMWWTLDQNLQITQHFGTGSLKPGVTAELKHLRKGMKELRLRATCVAIDGCSWKSKRYHDAIIFILEHSNGESLLVELPYKWGFLCLNKAFEEPIEMPLPDGMGIWASPKPDSNRPNDQIHDETSTSNTKPMERLIQVQELHAQGLITDVELQEKRKEIICDL